MSQFSQDFFLNQRLKITQNLVGYRAGIDAVLLAAAASFSKAEKICEFGAGVGTMILSTLMRKSIKQDSIIRALAIEKDENAFSLLAQNSRENGFDNLLEIACLDGLVPNSVYENSFDLVVSNPPFFDDLSKIRDPHESRHNAYIIGAPLEKWIKSMLRLCHSKGDILLIHRADRLYDILDALKNRAGDVRILPIAPKTGENANRIIIRAKKSSKAPLQMLPTLYLRDCNNPAVYFEEIDEMCNGKEIQCFGRLYE